MENKCPDKRVPNLAGIAAFAVSDFDAAEKYLEQAEKAGLLPVGRQGRQAGADRPILLASRGRL